MRDTTFRIDNLIGKKINNVQFIGRGEDIQSAEKPRATVIVKCSDCKTSYTTEVRLVQTRRYNYRCMKCSKRPGRSLYL